MSGVLGFLVGATIAIYFYAGRWSFSRIGGLESGYFLEPRLWLAASTVALALGSTLLAKSTTTPQYQRQSIMLGSVLVVAWLSYMALTSLWGYLPSLAFRKAYELGQILAVAASVGLAARRLRPEAMRWGFWIVSLAIGGVFILLGAATYSGGRLAVLGGGPNIFGRNMAMVVLGAGFLYSRVGKGALLGPVAIIAALLVILSGSRGAMAGLTVGAIVYAGLVKMGLVRRISATVLLVSVGAIVFLWTDLGQAATQAFHSRVVDLTFGQGYASGRRALFRQAMDIGLHYPVFGAGLHSFTRFTGWDYPHNLFLEVFSEGGGLGVALLGTWLAYTTLSLWRSRRRVCPATSAAFFLALASAQFSGDVFDSRGVVLAGLLAVAALPKRSRTANSALSVRSSPVVAVTSGTVSGRQSRATGSESVSVQ